MFRCISSGRVSNEENDENGGNEDNVDKRPQKFVTFETLIITFLTIIRTTIITFIVQLRVTFAILNKCHILSGFAG